MKTKCPKCQMLNKSMNIECENCGEYLGTSNTQTQQKPVLDQLYDDLRMEYWSEKDSFLYMNNYIIIPAIALQAVSQHKFTAEKTNSGKYKVQHIQK